MAWGEGNEVVCCFFCRPPGWCEGSIAPWRLDLDPVNNRQKRIYILFYFCFFFLPLLGRFQLRRVLAWVRENLPKAREQKAETAAENKRRHNDAKAHTGNQVYSCGSLAPKLKKGGCSDCQVRKGTVTFSNSVVLWPAATLTGNKVGCIFNPARTIDIVHNIFLCTVI